MTSFHLQITTPDGLIYDGEAESVAVRTIDGDVCILARHVNYVSALGYGEAHVTIEGTTRRAACIGGLISALNNEVRLVPTTFEWAEDIDAARAQRAKEAAEQMLKNAEDERAAVQAEAKLRRALVRLSVKE